MSIKVRERTLYDYICRVFSKYGWRCYSQPGVEEREPDLIIEGDNVRIVSEVKIDTEIKRTEAIVDAAAKARSLDTTNAVALLFERNVRGIQPTQLERVYLNLPVSTLILTDWLCDRPTLTLEDFVRLFTDSYHDWIRTKTARVNYDLVVDISRDAIGEIASYLRLNLTQKPILDSAMAVIGRFDIYKSLLEDFSGTTEEEAKLYIADIAAYILVNQLLFYHIISEKLGYNELPDVSPLKPPHDLLNVLDEQFEEARQTYPHILGLDLFPLLIKTKDFRIVLSVAKLVSTFKALRPQNIQEDLFGRLYHETIPPETRKNLGAFYTKPEAAKLLAILALNKWDAKVLDPACGSGTLLVESYKRKATLAPPVSRNELHKRFAESDIYGIDIMHFASHMTSTNITAQNIRTHVKPNVGCRDGIEAMVQYVEPTADPPLKQQPITRWLEIMARLRIPNDFDIIIMNPPFTRRERIPEEIETLKRLVPQVKGKTGYWAYFTVAADKVLKQNGILAVVIPEEFFGGRSASSVRRYFLDKGYAMQFVVRTSAELAFSEGALYRDYLVVLKKGAKQSTLIVTILKKKLKEIQNSIEELALEVKGFASSLDEKLSREELDAFKIFDADYLIEKHIDNLKPLVGFNTVKAHKLALELLGRLKGKPTLGDLAEEELIRIRVYNPGQYRARGVEQYSRKLFASKYGTRSPNVVLLLDKIMDDKAYLRLRKGRLSTTTPISATVPSLRTYSKVKHLDITNEEELAIVDPNAIPGEVLRLAGLMPPRNVIEAARDIEDAHNDLAGNIQLVRRTQLSSPELYWLAFYSDRNVLGTTSALLNMNVDNAVWRKGLTLYLNSTIALLQLIAFVAETRGAWVTFHGNQVWHHIHVPDLKRLSKKKLKKATKVFDIINKLDVETLYQRVKGRHEIQRSIDEVALEMVGLDDWKNRLDELYEAVATEIDIMHHILETSRRTAGRKERRKVSEEATKKTLDRWLKALD